MKNIFKFLLSSIALISFIPALNAQTTPPYTEGTGDAKGLAYSKTIDGPDNGIYTISLESFVMGEITIKQGVPADIVLVLDVSGSMNDEYQADEYEAQESTSYSYNSFGNQELYYRIDNNYYRVTRTTGSFWFSTYYALSLSVGGNTYYLKGTDIQQASLISSPGVNNQSTTIWTGVLYKKTKNGTSRLDELKSAVSGFIDIIKQNAEDSNMDNKLSIVKFASAEYYGSESSIAAGNHTYQVNTTSGLQNYNYTEVVRGWTSVRSGASSLKDAVESINAGGATAVDYGLRKAELLLADNEVNRESAKTVVVFTDGKPTHAAATEASEVEGVANDAINKAKTIKGTYAYKDANNETHNITVYSVGIFDNDGNALATGSNYSIKNYMDGVSSNYPQAASLSSPGSGSDEGFYQNAKDGDLSAIFRNIATASGGAAASLDAGTVEAIDVVSQSFDLPNGASTEIIVKFAACTGKTTIDNKEYLTFADKEEWIDNPPEGEDGHVTITITGNTVTASGFDYSEEWCGYDESVQSFHGHKMILLIPIEMADDAVGGQGVDTNGPGSGIFINGQNILQFDSPDVNLPTNIHIKKEGLSSGESAVFKIYRKHANKDGTPVSTEQWAYYKTVIVIEGINEDSTVKLRGLDPNYAYKIEEAGWSWAYDTTNPLGENNQELTEVTSDKLISNPFTFTNTLNTKGKTIIHAESAVVNDFKTSSATSIDSKNTAPKAQSSKGKK